MIQSEHPLRIALVDDHDLLLGGLAKALGEKPRIGEVLAFQDPAKLIDDLRQGAEFDLVVTDMLMGRINGLTLALELKNQFQASVLLMTGIDAPPSPEELERHAVKGFVHKSAPIDVLYEAIMTVSSGQRFAHFPEGWDPAKASPEFGRQSDGEPRIPQKISLSQRQIEVLRLVAAGAANKEIASTLDITENTVKTHLKHVFNALGVTKRTACVQAAKSRGLLD